MQKSGVQCTSGWAIVSLTVGCEQAARALPRHVYLNQTSPPCLLLHLHLPTHLPTSLPPPRLIPDDDIFISPPADLSAPPLVGPLMATCGRVKQSNWGRFCSKVHSPHQCKGCKERIALSAHLRSRVSKVPAQDKKAWVTHQREPAGARNATGDQDASLELREPISCVARDA